MLKKTVAGLLTVVMLFGMTTMLPELHANAIDNPSASSYEIFESNAEICTWEKAEEYCESLGGHLAVISSLKENDYLYEFMCEKGYDSAYFGYSDAEKEGVWKWVNNEKSTFTNWAPGEPNNEYGDENYAMFYWKFSDGTWNDGDFGYDTEWDDAAFICEWDDGKPTENTTVTYKLKGAVTKEVKNYTFKYSDKMLLCDADDVHYVKKGNPDIAMAACGIAMAAYEKDYIKEVLEQMGFQDKDITYYNYTYGTGKDEYLPTYEDNDHVMYAIAHKKVGGKHIFIVPVRGTHGDCEWFSNFNLGFWIEHQGFYKAESEIEDSLIEQFEKYNVKAEDVVLLSTGHSRGAAIANILTGKLSEGNLKIDGKAIPVSQIFGYTYACPNVCTYADTELINIHNYNNPGDLIPTLPIEGTWGGSQGFYRYGQTHNLNNKTGDINSVYYDFRHRFAEDTGVRYKGLSTSEEATDLLLDMAKDQDSFNSKSNRIIFDLIAASLMENDYYEIMKAYGGPSKKELIAKILTGYEVPESVINRILPELEVKSIPIIKIALPILVSIGVVKGGKLIDRIMAEGSDLSFIAHGHTGETYIHWVDATFNTRSSIPHEFNVSVVSPRKDPSGKTYDGYTNHACKICGYSYKSDIVPYATDISELTIQVTKNTPTYNGKTQKPVVTIRDGMKTPLTENKDYKIKWPGDITNAGKKTFTIEGIGDYRGTVKKTYSITRASIGSAKISVSDKVYTGKALTPNAIVKLNNKTLVKDKDYTVSYSSNINCGKAIVKVTGKGNYKSSVSASFIIKPAKVEVKKLTSPKTKTLKLTWAKAAGGISGYEVMIATNKAFTKDKKTYTVSDASAVSKTITGLKKGTTYYAKVRAYKSKYYGAWSAVKSVKCK